MAYLDTSVLGSYFCPESLSSVVGRQLESLADPVISPLVEVEFYSLLARKARAKELDRESAGAILGEFMVQIAGDYYGFVEIGSREYRLAGDWLRGFNTGLRTVDALHLAAAFANRQTLFTTDKALAAAARSLRVPCELIQ
jgi:uncharacterized protein